MMALTSLQGRYARSLFAVSQEWDNVLHSLYKVRRFFRSYKSLYALLCSVTLRQKERENMIGQCCHYLTLESCVQNFLKLLAENGRLSWLDSIIDFYEELVDKKMGRLRIEIKSAHPLNDDEKEILELRLKTCFNAILLSHHSVAPELLGGFMVKTKKKYWESSFRGHLKHLKNSLKHS